MSMQTDAINISGKTYLTVCLNPVIQKSLVFEALEHGEVNRTARYRTDVAGKGILPTRVLTQSGEKAIHLTQLGGPTRDWFLSMCASDQLDVRWVESGASIRFCTTIIELNGSHATELVEEGAAVAVSTHDAILKSFMELMPLVDAVLLSGTVAAGFRPGMMGELARLAGESGKHLYLDIKGRDLVDCLAARPVSVKPNLEELAATACVPRPANDDADGARSLVERIGREYFDRYGTYLVVTRGSRPTLFWDGSRLGETAVEKVEVINPIGSGDSFGAGLAVALEKGESLDAAVLAGTRLGALNAQGLKPGSILAEK